MNKTYIIISVLVILILGFFIVGKSNKIEAPTSEIPIVPEATLCTMDAKLCPDGSYVGRTGPKCEFTACPPVKDIQAVKEFIISGKNFSFTPSTITVQKGDKVKIIFQNSAGFHDFVIDEYGVATKQTQSPTIEVLEFTADKTGSFEYYCSVGTHKAMGMKGILKIE